MAHILTTKYLNKPNALIRVDSAVAYIKLLFAFKEAFNIFDESIIKMLRWVCRSLQSCQSFDFQPSVCLFLNFDIKSTILSCAIMLTLP